MQLKKLELVLENVTVNPEKAGGDDKGETGSALKFVGDALIDKLVGLSDCISTLAETLYGPNDGHELIAKDITKIEMNLRLEKVQASICGVVAEDERLRFSGCRLNSIVLTPKHGRACGVEIKLYTHPGEKEWNELVAMAKQPIALTLWGGSRVQDKPSKDSTKQLPLGSSGEAAPSPAAAATADAAEGVH